jgi:hypothetical protein
MGRPRRYDDEVAVALKQVWETADRICGKRLKPFMGELVAKMQEWEELRVTQDVADQLCQLSASTIDRLLRPHKDRGLRRPWSTTKPGSLLKASIPIRTFAEWDEGPSRVHRGGPGGPLWGHDRGVLPEHPDGGGHSHGLGGVSGSLG